MFNIFVMLNHGGSVIPNYRSPDELVKNIEKPFEYG